MTMGAIVRTLSRYADKARPIAEPTRPRAREARCEICAAPIDARHAHVLRGAPRAILCACGPCASLFRDPRASNGKYRAIPDRVIVAAEPKIADAAWSALGVPVGLAFVVRDSKAQRRRCVYPSPGGAIETEIDDAAFDALAEREPLARAATDDVEALLVRRSRGGAFECFVAPIDECYALVGAVRETWRDFDGGDEARAAIDDFFARLRARSRPYDGDGAS